MKTETLAGRTYHVFSDNYDEWFADFDEAFADFNRLVNGTAENGRLYVEETDRNGELIEEECLESFGDFPW